MTTTAKQTRYNRKRRHLRVRKNVKGIAEKPRLCVFRSLNHIYAQLADDTQGRTIVSASTLDSEIKSTPNPKSENAKLVGTMLGKRAKEKGIEQVVFDRGGYKYHGRVKMLADAAREAGLKF